MATRVQRVFDEADIRKIADAVESWKTGGAYSDEPGFCKSTRIEDIRKNDYVLTPGRYVGSAEADIDDEPFAEKMTRLTSALSAQFAESARLEGEIRAQLASIGYPIEGQKK